MALDDKSRARISRLLNEFRHLLEQIAEEETTARITFHVKASEKIRVEVTQFKTVE